MGPKRYVISAQVKFIDQQDRIIWQSEYAEAEGHGWQQRAERFGHRTAQWHRGQ